MIEPDPLPEAAWTTLVLLLPLLTDHWAAATAVAAAGVDVLTERAATVAAVRAELASLQYETKTKKIKSN